jgi:WD40 repeat protein
MMISLQTFKQIVKFELHFEDKLVNDIKICQDRLLIGGNSNDLNVFEIEGNQFETPLQKVEAGSYINNIAVSKNNSNVLSLSLDAKQLEIVDLRSNQIA